jgi:crossover junction endodeoxyribonuclease RuvC
MIILGIDPGSRFTGYGFIERLERSERLIEYGVIRLDGHEDHADRLREVFLRIGALIDQHRPDACALEMPVYARDAQAMLKLGRAQAAAMLAALTRDVPVTQYTPKEVKKAVTGNGNAAKEQVEYMVSSLLEIAPSARMGLDASDALAVALCHSQRKGSHPEGKADHRNWASFVKANPDRIR